MQEQPLFYRYNLTFITAKKEIEKSVFGYILIMQSADSKSRKERHGCQPYGYSGCMFNYVRSHFLLLRSDILFTFIIILLLLSLF